MVRAPKGVGSERYDDRARAWVPMAKLVPSLCLGRANLAQLHAARAVDEVIGKGLTENGDQRDAHVGIVAREKSLLPS